VNNLMSFFNPTLANPAIGGLPGALRLPATAPTAAIARIPSTAHYKNFGPRFGAAYRLNDKTVLRAGFAIMYVHVGGVGGRNNSTPGTQPARFQRHQQLHQPRQQQSGVLLG
jgi:hypothetical protein